MTQATSTATAGSSTRDRLLDAAAELFYREGVGVGVEALCRVAGVSKRSMYQLFDSKDAVLAASLERGAPAYQAFLLPPTTTGRRVSAFCTSSSASKNSPTARTSTAAPSWP